MADIKSASERSKNMSAIHSIDTKPEIVLRKALWKKGFRYRKNYNALPGKPDIVLTKYRICIFVDSEFFHGKDFYGGYESKNYKSLKDQIEHSNHPDFWMNKILGNMEHDREIDKLLREENWIVLRFWSKEILKDTDTCIDRKSVV